MNGQVRHPAGSRGRRRLPIERDIALDHGPEDHWALQRSVEGVARIVRSSQLNSEGADGSGVLVGSRDRVKQNAKANDPAKAVMDEQRLPASATVPESRPLFPAVEHDPMVLITQRHWSQPPKAAVSVVWRQWTRGEGGSPFWRGDPVDPVTYERIYVSHDRPDSEAEQRRTVSFYVAGAAHRLDVLNRPNFDSGQVVTLVPAPQNASDSKAIEVRDSAGRWKVGFVPRDRVKVADDESELIFDDLQEVVEEFGEEPPNAVEATFAQRLVNSWLARGPVAALIISEHSHRDDDGEWTSERGGITILASPQVECVEVPARGDHDYAEFTKAKRGARASTWVDRRVELRREIDIASDVVDRHFAVGQLIREAYRLRDAHPQALDDAIAACREQIKLGPSVAAVMRQRYERLPEHDGFKQLAIILEKQKAYPRAIDVVQQARDQGWDVDWEKRLDRLRRKQQ